MVALLPLVASLITEIPTKACPGALWGWTATYPGWNHTYSFIFGQIPTDGSGHCKSLSATYEEIAVALTKFFDGDAGKNYSALCVTLRRLNWMGNLTVGVDSVLHPDTLC